MRKYSIISPCLTIEMVILDKQLYDNWVSNLKCPLSALGMYRSWRQVDFLNHNVFTLGDKPSGHACTYIGGG